MSQTNIAVYNVVEIKEKFNISDTLNDTQKEANKLLLKAFDLAKSMNYTLTFNDKESIGSIDKTMATDEDKGHSYFGIAEALIGIGQYHQVKSNDISLVQKESMGELFLIESSLFKDWEIFQDQRQIAGYTCFLAKLKCEDCKNQVEVWFTPDIPVPFGPVGYGGLPGLVIEIKKYSSVLTLSTMELTNEPVEIKIPIKGIKISEDRYNELTKKARETGKGKF